MPSPVRYGRHSHPHTRLVTWLGNYETDTPGVEAGDNGTVRLDLDNEPQPDAFLIIRPEHGGQARISEDDYIEGVPELVAEVASSSASYDLGKKLNAYRRNGVREYVVWRVLDRQVDWFVNREGRFRADAPGGRWHPPQHGVSRPLARSRRLGARRQGDGPGGPPARPELRRAARLRGPAGASSERLKHRCRLGRPLALPGQIKVPKLLLYIALESR